MLPSIVSLKAFGDFVIASNIAKCVNDSLINQRVRLIAGEHVRELAGVLGLEGITTFVGQKDCVNVPAAFNIRKAGAFAALMSLIQMQRRLSGVVGDSDILFDNLKWRERIIGFGRNAYGLKKTEGNIYLDYLSFYENLTGNSFAENSRTVEIIKTALIVPGARMPHRVIPPHVISSVAAELHRHGVDVRVLLLEGETFNIPQEVPLVRVSRNFKKLVSALVGVDLVVSADSLSAHLSEFFNKPNFVFTPTPAWSIYWLPRSTFNSNGMADFNDISNFNKWFLPYSKL